MPGSKKTDTTGFTLFELLISMSVIAFLLTLAATGLQKSDNARSLDSAQSQLHGLLRIARSEAILNGTEARLIINFDPTDSNRFLRYAGVVYADENGQWVALGKGIFLPKGVYVVPQSSATFVNWSTVNSDRKSEYKKENTMGLGSAVFRYDFPSDSPVNVDTAGDPDWISYGFGPNGKLVTQGTTGLPPTGSHIALHEGQVNAAGGIVFKDSDLVLGIRIRQTGYSLSVDDPNAL